MVKTLLGALVLSLGFAVVAQAGRPTARRAEPNDTIHTKAKPGPGAATAGWKYVAVNPGQFVPTAKKRKSTRTFAHAVLFEAFAPIALPDGARIRQFGCWGDWGGNSGARVQLLRQEHHSNRGKILGVLERLRGTGRFDATLDETVTNHAHSYALWVRNLDGRSIRGCRIAYEVPG